MANDVLKEAELDNQRLQRTILHALRHDPWKYGLDLDDEGWAPVEGLMSALRVVCFHWTSLHWRDVERALGTGADRFQVQDGRIRASYGHSISLTRPPAPTAPPESLFHGTGTEVLPEVFRHGLQPGGRQFVHLTSDAAYALQVSTMKSYGIVLVVKASQAHAHGICFRKANHHVWLAKSVPAKFIEVTNIKAPAGIDPNHDHQ